MHDVPMTDETITQCGCKGSSSARAKSAPPLCSLAIACLCAVKVNIFTLARLRAVDGQSVLPQAWFPTFAKVRPLPELPPVYRHVVCVCVRACGYVFAADSCA